MKVHELIEILKQCEPNAEVIVGSHTLPHSSGKGPIGVWPAFEVETGEFPHGGPFNDQNHWVKVAASDAWGCCHFKPGGIRVIRTIDKPKKLGPLRKIVSEGVNEHGCQTETLECGHTILRKQDIIGYTNAYRRRCRHCLKEKQQ